ncbi:MAG: CHRD domain-containing protein [Oxalobacteraceae bacterium]|nr:CHRD domain-containing protein [Oxalobacteraceae bacterium]
MNTFPKKTMPVLLSALVVIVATGCASKAGTSDSGMMEGKSDGMMEGKPDGMMQGKPDGMMQGMPGGMMQGVSSVTLGGSQEVPPVNTMASGKGEITVSANKSVSGSIMTTGIDAKAAHIHIGAAGSNGKVVIALAKSADNRWLVPGGAKLSDDQYASYMAGNLYVNIHSAAHPDGEIRGQLRPK